MTRAGRLGRFGTLAVMSAAAAGCSGGGGSGPKPFDDMSAEEHLACAVEISAYTYLMAAGKVPEETELAGRSVLAVAWHHNAYAIPQGKSGQYALVNRMREELIAKDQPAAIAARAADCITSAVAKHEAK